MLIRLSIRLFLRKPNPQFYGSRKNRVSLSIKHGYLQHYMELEKFLFVVLFYTILCIFLSQSYYYMLYLLYKIFTVYI